MKFKSLLYLFLLLSASCSSVSQEKSKPVLLKIEVHLSAYGVESDHIPSIRGIVDFEADSSFFQRSFYNPALKASTYSLSKAERDSLHKMINQADFTKLKLVYKNNTSDQPTSTITFAWKDRQLKIEDYGLKGAPVLEEIYRLIYK